MDKASGQGGAGRGERVFVLENGKPKPVRVETGLSDGARTEVTGSLREGQPVVTGTQTAAQAKTGGAPFGMQQQRPRGMGGGGGGRR